MQRIIDLDKHLDSFGPVGSMSRLEEIARLDLGVRSEAAKRVIKSRLQKIEQNQNHFLNFKESIDL